MAIAAGSQARAREEPVPSWKNIGQTSLVTRRSTIGKISAQPQSCRSERGQDGVERGGGEVSPRTS